MCIRHEGRDVFVLRKDGTIFADWPALMVLKDKLVNDECQDQAELAICSWAAALWLSRNT